MDQTEKMENLPQLYCDVRIATIQLEYLVEIARAVLQPWPKRDSHGRVHTQSKQPVDITESHALLPSNDDDEKSVKLLDEILAKAQIAHDVTKRHRKANTAKTLAPYMESSTSRTSSKSIAKVGRAHSAHRAVGGAQSLEKLEISDQFTVEKHGNKIALPSKWSQLKAAIDKLADDKMEPMSKMEGEHFTQLLREQGGSDSYVNNCLIIRVTMEALIEDVTSIPEEHWTFNSRDTWQALYRVQRHLNYIQQLMVVLRKQMDTIPRSKPHSSKHQSSSCQMTYSSFKELLDYAESNTMLQLRLFQLKINQLCHNHFIPTVCASATATDAVITTNIRNIYSLIGLKYSPIFVHMTNNN